MHSISTMPVENEAKSWTFKVLLGSKKEAKSEKKTCGL